LINLKSKMATFFLVLISPVGVDFLAPVAEDFDPVGEDCEVPGEDEEVIGDGFEVLVEGCEVLGEEFAL